MIGTTAVSGCGGGTANDDAGVDAYVAVDAPSDDDAFVATTIDAAASPDAWSAPGVDAGEGHVVFRIRITETGGVRIIPGVRACEVGAVPENCAVGDERANITLGLPADQDVTIRYEREGYRSFDHLLHTGPADGSRTRYNMYTVMEEEEYYAPVGGISPTTGEMVLLFESVPGVRAIEGASVTVLEPAGTLVYYETPSGLSMTAGGTTSDSGAAVAVGLTASEIIVRATSASGSTCVPFFGGFEAPGMPGAFRLPVTVGRETRIDMNCP